MVHFGNHSGVVNTHSGIVNSDSGNSQKVFTIKQNKCSRFFGIGVHDKPEWVFTGGRNMHLAGINKQGFLFTAFVTVFGIRFFVFGQEPQAHRNLGGIEQLPRQSDHAIHQIVFNNLLANRPFTTGVGTHGTVRQHKTGSAVVRQFGDHVHDPGVVDVAGGWGFITVPA